jgi:putative addiction module component (TIGR02574 family)
MKLPPEEREHLVEELAASLPNDFASKNIEKAWLDEIGRRSDEIDAGTAEMLDWSDVQAQIARAAFEESKNYLDNADDQDAEREEIKGLLSDVSEIQNEVDLLFERLARQSELKDVDIKVGQTYDIDQEEIGGPVGRVVVTRVHQDEGQVSFRWITGEYSRCDGLRDDLANFVFLTDFGELVSDQPDVATGQVWRTGSNSVYEVTTRHVAGDGATGWDYKVEGNYTAWLRDAYFTGDFESDSMFQGHKALPETAKFIGYADDPEFDDPEFDFPASA